MFKANNQPDLFSFETELSKKHHDLLDNSKEKWFYNMVLRNINEDNFKPLYFDKASHPKALVNILVLTLIFKELKGISYDELRESIIEKKIEQIDQLPHVYTVECPYQKAVSTLTKQRHKIRFETKVCMLCLLKENCRVFKNKEWYYFTHEDYLQNKRNRNFMIIPGECRKIRPNVEALMKEFKARAPGGKAKCQGELFKTSLFAFNAGIAVNFGRIFRYIVENDLVNGPFLSIICVFHKILWDIQHIFSKTRVLFLQAIYDISCFTRNIFQKSQLYSL